MKIVYLSTSILPSRTANSIHVMKMCSAFSNLGHDVTLIAPERAKGGDPASIFEFYGASGRFSIVKCPWPGIHGKSLVYASCVWAKLREINPDLVYSRFLYGCVAPVLVGTPTIFESHQPVWHASRADGPILRFLAGKRGLRRLVVISESLAREYRSWAPVVGRKMLVAHDAADDCPSPAELRPWEGSGDRLQIGYAGNLYAGKGMEIIERIAPLVPDADFHVVGGMPEDIARWREKIRSPNVMFHGYVEQGRVGTYIRHMDICLLPNQRSVKPYGAGERGADIGKYTSPLKLFEYMAQAKPIISSDIPVLREILDETNALFASPESPEDWVKAINRLRDPRIRKEIGDKGREDFLGRHTWIKRAETVLESLAA